MPALSNKNIPPRERLIVALDCDSVDEAKRVVDLLGDSVWFYKVGLGLVLDPGYWDLIGYIAGREKQAFADIKIYDVPEQARMVIRQCLRQGVSFVTLHPEEAMIRAAIEARGDSALKLLCVTVLTSLDLEGVRALGYHVDQVEDLVTSRARHFLGLGCDGVISSGLEVPALRRDFGSNFLIVVPGVRNTPGTDDQKRTVDVKGAFETGADYIVVGRPIRNSSDPLRAAESIQGQIAEVFARDHR
jgi:orotidine-5'-phosphate decarboxylase